MTRDQRLKPIHPGKILREELLIPLNIKGEKLAQELKLDKEIIAEIIAEKRGINFEIASKLSSRFPQSTQFWLNCQRDYEQDLIEEEEKDPELKPIHPGEILREEYLTPLGIEAEELAKNIGVEKETIKEIVEEKHNITPDISCRLGLYFDLRDDYWLDLQKSYELDCWKKKEIVITYKQLLQVNCWKLESQGLKNLLKNTMFHGK